MNQPQVSPFSFSNYNVECERFEVLFKGLATIVKYDSTFKSPLTFIRRVYQGMNSFLATVILCLFFPYSLKEEIHFTRYLSSILKGLIQIARTGSVYLTLAVTIERYFAIVHPFKNIKKKLFIPVAAIFAIVYNIPKVLNR